MTTAQDRYYWRLVGMLKKAGGPERKVLHARLGLPGSHKDFSQADFDGWIAGCLAIAQPGNLTAQVAQAGMGATRLRVFIAEVVSALEVGPEYVDGVVRRMNGRGALGGRFLTYEGLGEAGLGKVVVALKREAKRRWPRKGNLLARVEGWVRELRGGGVSPGRVGAVLCAALRVEALPVLARLDYEELLVALGALRALEGEMGDAAELDGVCVAAGGDVEVPF